MADVAKTMKVVSNSSGGEVSLCELTSTNIETDSLEIHNIPSNSTDSADLTLNLPPNEETSLQELIESELALRKELLESQLSSDISNFPESVDETIIDNIEITQKNGSSLKSSPVLSPQKYDEIDYDDLDINTQFILAERNNAFQSFTGNDMFFFNTLDDTQINGTDPYLKDQHDLGDPFLKEEPNIMDSIVGGISSETDPTAHTETSDGIGECLQESSDSDCVTDSSVIKEAIGHITLSTFDPFTTIVDSSKSEPIDNPDIVETPSSECADSDFICLPTDTNNEEIHNGSYEKIEDGIEEQNLDGNVDVCVDIFSQEQGNVEIIMDDEIVTNDVANVDVNNSMESLGGSNEFNHIVDRVVTNVFDTLEIDDDEILLTPEEGNAKVVETPFESQMIIPEIDIIPPDDNEISESELVSNEELSIASNGVSPEMEFANALVEDNFGTWNTVSEAVETEPQKCLPETSEASKEIENETDSLSDDVDLHVCDDPQVCSPNNLDSSYSYSEQTEMAATKTEKKTKKKKSEGGVSTKTKKTKKTKKSDEKENISVQITSEEVTRLTHMDTDVTNEAQMSPKECLADSIVDDELSNVSVKELKQTYCSEARKSFRKPDSPEVKEVISTGVSIRELRRSFGDLSSLCNEEGVVEEQDSVPINIDMKSSFSKFDQMSKKTVLHVRSVDASKVQKQFNQTAEMTPEQMSNCKSCGKQVFQMEQVKAERAVWHKNCFRCKECNKQLTVDIYSSHEGQLYCKPHFRELFKPKAVVDEDLEPPSDKPDLGLEELSSLNVKSRYQVFEKTDTPGGSEVERSPSSVSVKRSPSILSKLARFQAKGMDIGVTDDSLNGIPYEETSSSSEEEEEVDGEGEEADRDLIRSNRKQRERPVSFSKMEDIKCRWESGQAAWKEERREERKQEIQNIRSRLFLGKQGKMKEMYEQAVKDSENVSQKKEVGIRSDKAKSIKERFERGEVLPDEDAAQEDDHSKKTMDEDMNVFEAGISKKSRSLFLELDATAAKTQQQSVPMSPLKSPLPSEGRRTSREANSPEREIYRDPHIVRSDDKVEDEEVMKTNTARKMLSIFRQLEENATKEEVPEGLKPLKRFTPPPDYTHDSESSEEETESDDEEEEDEEDDVDPNIVRASDKIEDEFLKQAQNAARAKVLRAKFERWEEKENKANANAATNASHAVGNLNGSLELDQSSEHTSIDTTKSLRARFESLKSEAQQPKERVPRPKVNRFVEIQSTCAEFCSACEKKVYPLEKVETGGKLFHKQCFRCLQCNCILRMETYTLNNGQLYCIPHFKQLFIAKGNYEEGFGLDQHKRKWSSRNNNEDDLLNTFNNSTDH